MNDVNDIIPIINEGANSRSPEYKYISDDKISSIGSGVSEWLMKDNATNVRVTE